MFTQWTAPQAVAQKCICTTKSRKRVTSTGRNGKKRNLRQVPSTSRKSSMRHRPGSRLTCTSIPQAETYMRPMRFMPTLRVMEALPHTLTGSRTVPLLSWQWRRTISSWQKAPRCWCTMPGQYAWAMLNSSVRRPTTSTHSWRLIGAYL